MNDYYTLNYEVSPEVEEMMNRHAEKRYEELAREAANLKNKPEFERMYCQSPEPEEEPAGAYNWPAGAFGIKDNNCDYGHGNITAIVFGDECADCCGQGVVYSVPARGKYAEEVKCSGCNGSGQVFMTAGQKLFFNLK